MTSSRKPITTTPEYPDTIKVGPFNYALKFESRIYNEGQRCFGQIDYFTQEITVDAEITGARKQNTVLHELVHAICTVHELELDEREVDQISIGLSNLIQDNPQLMEVLS